VPHAARPSLLRKFSSTSKDMSPLSYSASEKTAPANELSSCEPPLPPQTRCSWRCTHSCHVRFWELGALQSTLDIPGRKAGSEVAALTLFGPWKWAALRVELGSLSAWVSEPVDAERAWRSQDGLALETAAVDRRVHNEADGRKADWWREDVAVRLHHGFQSPQGTTLSDLAG
jgi:hypothetical protein